MKVRSLIDSKKRAEVKKALAEGRLDKLLDRKKASPEPVQTKRPKQQLSPEEQNKLNEELFKGLDKITELHYNPNPQGVKPILERGADPNAKNEEGETALIVAVNKYDVILDFTCRGKDVSSFNKMRKYQSKEGIKYMTQLLEAGADVNATDNKGRTAWDRARHCRPHIRALFEKYGAKGC